MADRRSASSLDALFRPASVAVIGASREPGTIGHQILLNLVRGEFRGPVYPVNPSATHVASMRAYASVSAIPDPVELAIVVVPREHVLGALEQCGAKGVGGVVIITAGFRELGGEGAELEARIRELCARHGMRLVGPNCMGILNTDPAVRLNATFARSAPRRGRVAFLSQSGALGEAVLSRAREIGVGLAMFASIGNKADVSSNDLLAYWGGDDDVDVILLYLENFGNPLNFSRIAREVTRRKPVIAVKSGRTAAGARAASSHTGSLAGSDAATEALLAQCGVLRALTVEELFDLAKAFSLSKPPRGRRVTVVSNAGGPGILAADACEQWGLKVAPLAESVRAAIRPHVHPNASLENPIDLIASAEPVHYRAALGPILGAAGRDAGTDAAIVLCVPPSTIDTTDVARALAETPREVPVLACFMGIQPPGLGVLESAGIPLFEFPESAVRALAALVRYRELAERAPGATPAIAADRKRAREIVARARSEARQELTLAESLALVACYGIESVQTRAVTDRDAAIDAARSLGYPVVLKSGAPGHKTERNAIAVDLRSTDDLVAAWDRIFRSGASHELLPAVVQPMLADGREIVLGLATDRDLGPLVMLGIGGVFVELLRDVAFRLAPLTDVDAREMIGSLKGLPLLTGYRGSRPIDLAAVEAALHGIAALALDLPEIAELDVNPLIAFPAGKPPLAVDARARLSPASPDSRS